MKMQNRALRACESTQDAEGAQPALMHRADPVDEGGVWVPSRLDFSEVVDDPHVDRALQNSSEALNVNIHAPIRRRISANEQHIALLIGRATAK